MNGPFTGIDFASSGKDLGNRKAVDKSNIFDDKPLVVVSVGKKLIVYKLLNSRNNIALQYEVWLVILSLFLYGILTLNYISCEYNIIYISVYLVEARGRDVTICRLCTSSRYVMEIYCTIDSHSYIETLLLLEDIRPDEILISGDNF